MALGNCRECGKEVSDGAKICPNCGIKTPIRKSVTLIQAVIVIFIGAWIISKMGGMLGFEHTASITTASVTPKVSSISVDSLYVNGKEIQIGDTDDQVFKLLTKDQLVSQTEEKDPNNALSLLVVKHIQVNGKKFAVYFSRVQDPEPYKVTKIIENTASVTTSVTSKVSSIPNVPKKMEPMTQERMILKSCAVIIFFSVTELSNITAVL
ncbi:MAG: zinc ribbon domain-containing protein [Desulfocapsaceae bacterium]|nr:zinc ribbon domain-containing protein [Desulfocapsaceae bacterium]